jgi:hypothetical protein
MVSFPLGWATDSEATLLTSGRLSDYRALECKPKPNPTVALVLVFVHAHAHG